VSEKLLLVATRNAGKAKEISAILAHVSYTVVFPDDVGLRETRDEARIEVGETFEANARLKAEYFSRLSNLPTAADDSGLEVFALGGRPGVQSRRFAEFEGPPDQQDRANNDELLRRLAGLPIDKRRARYRCSVVFVPRRDAASVTFEGACSGRILDAPHGSNGFGYDPLFWSDDLEEGFGLVDPSEKDRVSHRGRAFRAFADWLMEQGRALR
jgi:XTP/dITP diphosphohydrolase